MTGSEVSDAELTETTIALLPAGLSVPLSPSNEFAVSPSVSNGSQVTSYSDGGVITIETDLGTNVTVSGLSNR